MNSRHHASGRLFTGGDIYNTVDPFATALLVEEGVVAWLGSDEAAEGTGVARNRGALERVDLAGDLIAPAFVNARAEVSDARDEASLLASGLAAGIAGVHVVTTSRDAIAPVPSGARVTRFLWLEADAAGEEALGWVRDAPDFLGVAIDASDPAAAALLVAATGLAVPVRLRVSGPEGLDRLERALGAAEADHGHRVRAVGHRLDLEGPVSAEDVGRVAATYLPVTLTPSEAPAPIAALLAAGVSLSFGFGDHRGDPWGVLRAAVFSGQDGAISARAAYTAATRGGWRAIGLPEEGTIRLGSPTPLARWQVDSLVVQAADDRVAAWSTDPRSGTPGLPDLSGPRPTFVELV